MCTLGMWAGSGFFVFVAVGGVAACTTGTGGSTVPGVSSTETSYCEQRAARSRSCAPDTGVSLPPPDAGTTGTSSACAEDFRCAVAIYANPEAYLNCKMNPDCSASTSDKTCNAKASEGVSTRDADACLKKRADCKATGAKTFDDDTCAVIPALNAALAQKVVSCLDQPCDQIEACIKSVGDQILQCN